MVLVKADGAKQSDLEKIGGFYNIQGLSENITVGRPQQFVPEYIFCEVCNRLSVPDSVMRMIRRGTLHKCVEERPISKQQGAPQYP